MYTGARGRITHQQLDSLSGSWVVQPKMDGVYARIDTDSCGVILSVRSRNGVALSHSLPALGIPNATLCGELEAQTERSQEATARRGAQGLHLFDALRLDGKAIDHETYEVRRGKLQRSMADAESNLSRDGVGRCHDLRGRFAAKLWRSVSVVQQLHASRWEEMWSTHVEGSNGEGLVAVNLKSKAGARGAKRKCKLVDHESMTVMRVDRKTVELVRWGHRRGILVSRGSHAVVPGDMVDVAVEGWYRSGLPRFARIVNVRRDLL